MTSITTPPRVSHLALPRGRRLALTPGAPKLVGIVNITPDSFSDGGLCLEPRRATDHALALLAEGAEVLDLGAESTRPGGGVYGAGASAVATGEELARLLPVLELLRPRTDAPISVDTRKAEVARAAIAAGADLINDVSALADPGMAAVVAEAGCPVVLMHSRGALPTMQVGIAFRDVAVEVRAELAALAERARCMGIAAASIVVDPGLGFGKTAAQNLELLRRLPELAELGYPILVGASRKSFLGAVTGAPAADRVPESLAAAVWAASGGAALLRVHDVGETRRFLASWRAIAAGMEASS
ncbi:MAG: dihydropteroate synthase [Thermoanaerobaculia bacterium]